MRFCGGETVTWFRFSPAVEQGFDPRVPFRVAKQRAADAWEQTWVRELMAQTKGTISEAARVARMDRSHLRTLLRKYSVSGRDDSSEAGSA